MKNRILAAFLAVIMMLGSLGVVVAGATDVNYYEDKFASEAEKLATMGNAYATSENKLYELYFDEKSGELAVKNTKTGEILLSNPYSINDNKLNPNDKGKLLSQIFIYFTTITTGQISTLFSYNDCFMNGQQTITKLENGVKVEYVLGEKVREFLVPLKISVADMDKILEQIENVNDQTTLLNYYSKYDPNETNADGSYKYPEVAREMMIKLYPICETTPIYVIKNPDADKTTPENIIKTYTDYTMEQLYADYEKVKDETDTFSSEPKPSFKLVAEYTITNDGLVAEVDASKLEYDKTRYYINTIAVLPYFSAAKRADLGYTFIPDGSGALVRFEDVVGKNVQAIISGNMYGNDYAYYQVTAKNTEQYTMPVFGLVNNSINNGVGYFAIIEDGDSLATINSEHSVNYHSAYATFKITPTDVYDLADAFSSGSASSNAINVTASSNYDGKCRVKYVLLTDSETAKQNNVEGSFDASYFGMAQCYKNYLEANGIIDKLKDEEINKDFVKIFLETFGSIQVEEKVATFPVMVHKPLTTFDDIKEIYKDLKDNGVGNMSFILKGYANGGILSTYPTSLNWQGVLGGKDGLNSLIEYAKLEGFEIAPDVEFTYSYGSTGWFSGFSNKDHGVRTLDNRYTTKRTYYAATQTFERTGGVAISTASFEYVYNKFYSSASEYQLTALSVKTLGSDLNSDFNKDAFLHRESSKDKVVTMLKLLTGKENENKSYNLIVDAGNAYSVPYAKAILSASLDSSRLLYASESVPFLGIVYHGSVEFAGNAINMEGDTEYMFLKAIENGSALYFTLVKQNAELLKFDEQYNKYYSVDYKNLRDIILETYKEYNEIMKDNQNKYIVAHTFMNSSDGFDVKRAEDGKALDNSLVVSVEYEGGNGFILNYNAYDVVVNYGGTEYKIESLGYAQYTVAE